MAKRKQWHPLFAELLRPLVQSHHEVETNVPVGDVPREVVLALRDEEVVGGTVQELALLGVQAALGQAAKARGGAHGAVGGLQRADGRAQPRRPADRA